MNKNDLTDEELLEVVGSLRDEDTFTAQDSLIILEKPIEEGGQTYAQVQLSEPTLYQVLSATQVIGKRPTRGTVYDSQMRLVALVSGLPDRVVKRLPTRVIDRAVEFVVSFEERARRGDDFEIEDLDLSIEKTLLFKSPVPGGGQQYSEMRLREPEGTERRRYEALKDRGSLQDILRSEMQLVEDVSQWNRAALLRLPISRFIEAIEYLTGFFTAGLPTGERSLPN